MSLNLNTHSLSNSKSDTTIHNVQCEIEHNGTAKIDQHFTSAIRNNDEAMTSSIRGRPMDGCSLSLPEGYIGLVLNEKRKPFTEDEERELHISYNFKSFTYWNLDSKPNCNDAIQTAMKWPGLAKAIHDPIED